MDNARIGPYELQKPLGAGGMAETFLALKRGPAGFEQRVCLKRILPGRAADPRFVELFLDEARLGARLQHGCIVQVYDFGKADDSYYMALELVEGADLEVLLSELRRRGGRLDVATALYIAGQVLAALHYAHDLDLDGELLGVVHRDISPSNVMVSDQGEVKLTDFGIAKARGRQHKTETGHTKGKIAYMSPEQVQGDPLDRRSDLFAVGVLLYEMLTGIHPFDAETDLTLLNNIVSGNRPPLSPLVPELPSEVAALVDLLLAPNRDERAASAGQALARLPVLESAFSVQTRLGALVKTVRPERLERLLTPADHAVSDGGTELLAKDAGGSAGGFGAAGGFGGAGMDTRPPAGGSKTWIVLAVGAAAAGLAWGALSLWPAPTSKPKQAGLEGPPVSASSAAEGEPTPAGPERATSTARESSAEPNGLARSAPPDTAEGETAPEDAAAPIILGLPLDEAAQAPAPALRVERSKQKKRRVTRSKDSRATAPKVSPPSKPRAPETTGAPLADDGTAARSGADVDVGDF